MRLLEEHELSMIGGADGYDTFTFNAPFGYTFTSQLQPNNSTTITLKGPGVDRTWNSGEFIACSILDSATGLTVHFFSRGNPFITALATELVGYGCSKAFSHTDHDGDEFS